MPDGRRMADAAHNLAQNILCVGLSHQTAPIELRERVAKINSAWHDVAVGGLRGVRETVTLSTCNRFEVYLVGEDDLEPIGQHALAAMQQCVGITTVDQTVDQGEHFYMLTGEQAIRHLYRVAAGLDSQVMGESEVLGQVSRDYAYGVATRTAGLVLRAVFQGAIRAGKRARAETQIGRNAGSTSTMAVSMAEAMAGDLRQARVAVVGAGEMATQVLKALAARKARNVAVINRTYRRAAIQAQAMDWQAFGLDQLTEALAGANIVFTATAAPDIVISTHDIEAAAAHRDARPLLIFDIAVPRDVDPAVAAVPGVKLIDLDGLRQQLDAALEARRLEVPRVEAIIDDELRSLDVDLSELDVRPTVVELRARAESVRRREVERTLRALGDGNADVAEQLNLLTRALVNKILHDPTAYLKQMAHEGEAAAATAVVRELFGLSNGIAPTAQPMPVDEARDVAHPAHGSPQRAQNGEPG